MAQLVAEKIAWFDQEWNSPFHTAVKYENPAKIISDLYCIFQLIQGFNRTQGNLVTRNDFA